MAMAMGRFLSQRLVGSIRNPTISISNRILTQRHRSDKVDEAQLIEVDLDTSSSTTSSSSSSSDADADISGTLRKLEEVIQSVVARRAAPDWLPFLPGHSYWVPPTSTISHPGKFIEVVGEMLAAPPPPRLMREYEDTMPSRMWPSSPYIIQGSAPSHKVPMELEWLSNHSEDESSNENEDEEK